MQSRTWMVIVVVVILLSAGAGLLWLSRDRAPAAAPTTTPAAVAPTPTATATSGFLVAAPSPPPAPFLYVIQPGDTLAGIAAAYGLTVDELIAANSLTDPNVIQAGQPLIIPGLAAPTATPLPTRTPLAPGSLPPTPLPTPTLSGPPLIEIAGVLGAGSLETEMAQVRNRGGMASLEGWTLSSAAGSRFVFPRLVLFTGGQVAVHSSAGASNPLHLYWGRAAPVWRSGELLTLQDQQGAVLDTYIVP
jgi:LysM repeat protein